MTKDEFLEAFRKLKFREQLVVIDAPEPLDARFREAGAAAKFDGQKLSINTLVFVSDSKQLLRFLKGDLKKVVPDSLLWIAYPKGTSKIPTDINRDSIWKTAEEYGITSIAAVSIDKTWSALRFRPIEKVGT